MEDLKTYKEWCSIIEHERGMKIIDDDGGRILFKEGRLEDKITRVEAEKYFMRCTICGTMKSINSSILNRLF